MKKIILLKKNNPRKPVIGIIGAIAVALYATLIMEENPCTHFCRYFNDDHTTV